MYFALLWGFTLVAYTRSQPVTSEAVQEEVAELLQLGIEKRVRRGQAMNPELKAPVIRAIAGIAVRQEKAYREQYYDIMFDLGDEATVKKYAEAYLKDSNFSGAGLFPTCQNPHVIELIAPAIFREEGWVTKGPYTAQSFSASKLILEMLGQTPGFDSDVINWARRVRTQIRTLYDVRDVMRDWWRENEKFFKERNYQAVRPGRDIKPVAEAELAAEVPTAPATTPEPVSPKSMPVASTPGESPTPSSGFLWTCAAGAIALLVSLVVFWKRRPS